MGSVCRGCIGDDSVEARVKALSDTDYLTVPNFCRVDSISKLSTISMISNAEEYKPSIRIRNKIEFKETEDEIFHWSSEILQRIAISHIFSGQTQHKNGLKQQKTMIEAMQTYCDWKKYLMKIYPSKEFRIRKNTFVDERSKDSKEEDYIQNEEECVSENASMIAKLVFNSSEMEEEKDEESSINLLINHPEIQSENECSTTTQKWMLENSSMIAKFVFNSSEMEEVKDEESIHFPAKEQLQLFVNEGSWNTKQKLYHDLSIRYFNQNANQTLGEFNPLTEENINNIIEYQEIFQFAIVLAQNLYRKFLQKVNEKNIIECSFSGINSDSDGRKNSESDGNFIFRKEYSVFHLLQFAYFWETLSIFFRHFFFTLNFSYFWKRFLFFGLYIFLEKHIK